jgi:hypothetical protein
MNNIEIKVFIYWFVIVIIAHIVDFINKSLNGKNYSDKWWSDNSHTHIFKTVILYGGLLFIGAVMFARLTKWWFN